jgi:hypothetical protein
MALHAAFSKVAQKLLKSRSKVTEKAHKSCSKAAQKPLKSRTKIAQMLHLLLKSRPKVAQ